MLDRRAMFLFGKTWAECGDITKQAVAGFFNLQMAGSGMTIQCERTRESTKPQLKSASKQ